MTGEHDEDDDDIADDNMQDEILSAQSPTSSHVLKSSSRV